MKKSKMFFCAMSFIAVSAICLLSKPQKGLSSVNDLMMQNVMALSNFEQTKFFVVEWKKEIGRVETPTYIEITFEETVTCPPKGPKDCTPYHGTYTTRLSKRL